MAPFKFSRVLTWAILGSLAHAISPQGSRGNPEYFSEADTSSGNFNFGDKLFEYEKIQLTNVFLENIKGTIDNNKKLTSLLGFASVSQLFNADDRPACKAYPGTPNWPSDEEWKAFGVALGGSSLIKTIPLAAPCFNSWPDVHDNASCAYVEENWDKFRYQVDDSASASFPLFEGRTCVLANAPDGNCTVGGYPVYAVNISTVAQIQMTVNFARNANLRLVVKNKGHDYNAKSTGGGGLSIFTGNLRDIRYIPEYSYPRGNYTGPAFKIGPGVEMGMIYEYADSLNLSVVGGIGRTIGLAGGYSLGGGHSLIASMYGLGADQVLSIQAVLPDGSFVTVDQDSNPNLYWAFRGGGGSTFGVVTSAVIAAYPRMPVVTLTYSIANRDPNTTETFWAGIREFYQTFVSNADAGQYLVFRLACNLPSEPWNCTLSLIPHWANNVTVTQFQEYMNPYFTKLDALGVPVISPVWTQYLSLWTAWNTTFASLQSSGSASGTSHVATRIFPRRNFADPALFNTTFTAFRYTIEVTNGRMQAFQLKAASNSRLNQDNAAHPAWRDTVLFAMMTNPWNNETATAATIAERCKQLVERLQPWRDVTPDGGSYLNEGDINEPEFQEAFYGANYQRLYALKQKYDPTGTFYAPTAVGSEDWYVTGQIPYYPTSDGRLCRVAA